MRLLVGAAIALAFYAIGVMNAALNYLLDASIRERTTSGALVATAVYFLIFAGAGALGGWLSGVRSRWLRFVSIGAIAGALMWSYYTATWSLTARASALSQPGYGVLEAVFVGGILGALGGVLLVVVIAIRAVVRREQ